MPLLKSTVCIAEDREAFEPCLKLLLTSLDHHSPGLGVSLFYPVANQAFCRWVSAYPQIQLQSDGLKKGYGWNVKPEAIMQLLDAGLTKSSGSIRCACYQGHSSIIQYRRGGLCGGRANTCAEPRNDDGGRASEDGNFRSGAFSRLASIRRIRATKDIIR